jgi:hypothetical protein
MKNAQNFDFIMTDPIGDDVGRAVNDQFAGPGNSSGPTKGRILLQLCD